MYTSDLSWMENHQNWILSKVHSKKRSAQPYDFFFFTNDLLRLIGTFDNYYKLKNQV